jgi:hypothetical protein
VYGAVVHAVVLLAVLRLTLKLDLGAEYDSNANRSEVTEGINNPDPPVGSALIRTTARAALQWKRGINLLRVQLGLGAKAFFDSAVRDQSVFVVQGGLDDRIALGRRGALTLSGDYYDAFQDLAPSPPGIDPTTRRRDFRTGTVGARLSLFQGPGSFWLGLGYRGLHYKPTDGFDFQAPTGDLGASVAVQLGTEDAPHELSFSAGYHVERRAFNAPQEIELNYFDCAPDLPLKETCFATGPDDRLDWWHETNFELTYVGALLASLSYGAQLARSNSLGQSLLRHIVALRLSYRLPWRLYATVKGQLMISNGLYKIGPSAIVSTLTFATIEDENRNAVIADLEREIGKTGLAVDARYSFFANELGTQHTSFRRHVAYLGLTYRFSTR